MKKLFTTLLFTLISTLSFAQVIDTLLFEDFQTDNSGDWGLVPFGDDVIWVAFDEDALNPFDNDDNHRTWYHSDFFYNAEDTITGEVNYCAASLSYMEGFLPGNRNWLITPPIEVTNANFTLHWKSAPFQLPRYCDGYLVLAAVGSNDLFEGYFQDTLFQTASMDQIIGEGQSVILSNFSFTPGYLHADSLTNDEYVDLWAPGDSTLMHGILEPHSVSLSQYEGQTVYFAFLHNSDDDYFIAVDDILVTSTTTSGTEDLNAQDIRFVSYPNPVDNWLNVLYRLPEAAMVSLRVIDMNGRTVLDNTPGLQAAGEQQINLNLAKLPAGSYTLNLQVSQQTLTKVFIKK